MEHINATTFLLLGFPGLCGFRIVFFLCLIMIYITTICGNLLVIILVARSKNLQSPMYFFLTQLTISDMMISSDIVPNMLHMVLNDGSFMSISRCLTQFFFFGFSETSECLLLTAMSYDRYLAICHPLHYHYIMNPLLCLRLVIIFWILGFISTLIVTLNVSRLHFCRSGVIDHFFCDYDPLLKVSCSNILKIMSLSTIMSLLIIMFPFLVVVVSYVFIVHTILRIRSVSHRLKVFSTCGSHLTVVTIFYGSLISIYSTPKREKSDGLRKILSLVYTVVTPFTNPVIYCLRNRDIKDAFKKMISYKCIFCNYNIS